MVSQLNTTGSSKVSIPRALVFDDDEVVGGGGGESNKKSKRKNRLSPFSQALLRTEKRNFLTPGARAAFNLL